MSRFNDIEREFERFEAEIEQLPAATNVGQVRPQQQAKPSAFIPPQLRIRAVQPPMGHRAPPPPMPPQMAYVRPGYQPAMQGNFVPAVRQQFGSIRPNTIIEAKPIKYNAAEDGAPVVASGQPVPASAPSEALARAKAILDSLKAKSEAPAPAAETVQMMLAKPSSAGASAASSVPMPANMPGASSSAGVKKAAKQQGASTSADADEFSGTRKAGGEVWTDMTLFEWDPNDHRLFCGDLGNETTDESLAKVFSIYPSFQKAKVIRDKRTNKSRGFGFVSFKDALDLARAIREMNGKYVGNRPIKLRKSTWKDRNVEVVKKKEKVRKRLGLPF